MSLRLKTISGFKWSFIDNFANTGIQFIVGLVLARLLSPNEFGLIGMLTFFIAISQAFVDSGFGQALIRKQNCTETDYSTVFFFNLFVGILFYFVLFFIAGPVSHFYKEPQLFLLLRVLGLVLIINAVTIVQRTILIKDINFKLQTQISLISTITSGLIAIVLAYNGYGVWCLVWKTILQNAINSFLLWVWNRYRPVFTFSIDSFREMFGFSYKLLLSGLIDGGYRNIYLLIIGKFFSATELGFYTRADMFNNLPSSNITAVIQRVSYPVLSSLQDNPDRLKFGYKKLIKNTMFISFVLMLGMASVAKPMIVMLIGNKWLPSVPYLQLLCFVGMLYPLHALNLNILTVRGRSDLFLKLEVIKKILGIPTIIIGIFFGIKAMIIGMIVYSMIAYFINSYWTNKLIAYPVREQLLDIAPSFIIAMTMGAIMFIIGSLITIKPVIVFFLQFITGGLFVIFLGEIVKLEPYLEIKQIIIANIRLPFFTKKKSD